jgi:hypothetical protein
VAESAVKAKRKELQDIFLGICDHVYFQPPESIKLTYPCIIYKRDKMDTKYANNKKYAHLMRYQVKVIDNDPDSDLPSSVLELSLCNHVQNFVTDGLNHDVFELYY